MVKHDKQGMTVKNERPSVMMDEQGVIDIEQGVTNGAKIHLPEQGKSKDVTRVGLSDMTFSGAACQGVTERTGINLAAIGLAEALNDIGGTKLIVKPKRGKDIKTFADLPPDVQQTIDSLSMVDGKICQTVKANRTAIAINYQHLFPDRFHSTGVICSGPVVTGKPKCLGCMLDSLTKKHDKDCTASPENQRKLEVCKSGDDHSTGVAV